MKRAYLIDLDNTIFSTPSIGDVLFKPVLQLIKESAVHDKDFDAIKYDLMRKPFQVIAEKYQFSEELKHRCSQLLEELQYHDKIAPFDDYDELRRSAAHLFLVTAGYRKMQQSKIDGLGIAHDFREINIIDSNETSKTKKDVFADIMNKYKLKKEEVLIIGDDPESEIKAGTELGVDTVLYDKTNAYGQSNATYTISDYRKLPGLLAGAQQ